MERRKHYLGDKKEFLIARLRDAGAMVEKSLTRRAFKKMIGFPSVSTYEKYFGTWNNAKNKAGLETLLACRNGIKDPSRPLRAVPLKTRFEILKRDHFTCQYCGRTPQDGAKLTVDHIHPYSKGGLTIASNLITACFECNAGKRDAFISANSLKFLTTRKKEI